MASFNISIVMVIHPALWQRRQVYSRDNGLPSLQWKYQCCGRLYGVLPTMASTPPGRKTLS
jgi:hypothetical protein